MHYVSNDPEDFNCLQVKLFLIYAWRNSVSQTYFQWSRFAHVSNLTTRETQRQQERLRDCTPACLLYDCAEDCWNIWKGYNTRHPLGSIVVALVWLPGLERKKERSRLCYTEGTLFPCLCRAEASCGWNNWIFEAFVMGGPFFFQATGCLLECSFQKALTALCIYEMVLC